jgi:hypothetical protein
MFYGIVHFIKSKNVGGKHVVLWQRGSYHYEIEVLKNDEAKRIDLYNTCWEDAVVKFDAMQ